MRETLTLFAFRLTANAEMRRGHGAQPGKWYVFLTGGTCAIGTRLDAAQCRINLDDDGQVQLELGQVGIVGYVGNGGVVFSYFLFGQHLCIRCVRPMCLGINLRL
jgi:hypothetical protein